MIHRIDTNYSRRAKFVLSAMDSRGCVDILTTAHDMGVSYRTMKRVFERMVMVGDIERCGVMWGRKQYRRPKVAPVTVASKYVPHDEARRDAKIKAAIAARDERVAS